MKIDDVVIGDRFRQDLGNVNELAQSIADVGLLHPIVITPDNVLIAGRRRLEACKLLGLIDIPATVVDFDKKPSRVAQDIDALPSSDQESVMVFCDEQHADSLEKIYQTNAQFAIDADRCAVCGYTLFIEQHHFLPKEYGGTDDPRNIIYLCPTHHRGIHWLMRGINPNNYKKRAEFWSTDGKADKQLFEFYLVRIAWIADILKEMKWK